jgi:hypothetical protein
MPNIEKDPRFWFYNTKFGRIVSFIAIVFVIGCVLFEIVKKL